MRASEGEGDMRTCEVNADVAVVGGGLAGVCAAIAAARQGQRVVLLQNRPVLGGNSSSEVRVWVCGATAHGVHQWARETGIMGELFVENQFTNREGNPYYWDLVVAEAVRSEPNIELWLNTDVRSLDSTDAGIQSVTGWQMGSETTVTVRATAFVDATGDGLIGHLAGAEYRTGREARDVYDEDWAPDTEDAKTLGSTILFYTKDRGAPSPFVAPPWAIDMAQIPEARRRAIRSTMNGCDYWWIEWGGDMDVVDDNERIRDELHAVVYGIWDHIKNSGEFSDVENRTLEWIGSVPGKREYRRFIGDHVLTQHDVIGRVDQPDAVAYGGWSIDLHPPGGIYAPEAPSRHWHPAGNYDIPLRCLYSRNVPNLWVAGRDISASHVAFGSTRVMATCAVIGEGAGLGAALSVAHGLTPAELAHDRFDLVAHELVRTDASVLGLANTDPNDLARRATVRASSTDTRLEALPNGRLDGAPAQPGVDPEVPAEGEAVDHTVEPGDVVEIGDGIAMILPGGEGLRAFDLWVTAATGATLELKVHRLEKQQDTYPSAEILGQVQATAPSGSNWVSFDLSSIDTAGGNAFMSVSAVDGDATAQLAPRRQTGVIAFTHREMLPEHEWTEQFREWKVVPSLRPFCFRVPGGTTSYSADNVIGGYARPYGGPQLWSSSPDDPAPELELEWDTPVTVAELQVLLDDDVAVDLINLHHHITPDEVMPTLLRDYDLQVKGEAGWATLAEIRGNRRRHNRHRLDAPRTITALRLRALATNGADRAHVVKLRAYGPTDQPQS